MNWKILWSDMCYVAGKYPFQLLAVFIVALLIGSAMALF